MIGKLIQFILLLIAHAAAGIYSSTLKYTKKTTYLIWGTWLLLQTALLCYTEFALTDWMLQFLVGFVLSLMGQYVLFFVTTKGRPAQRIFTILTYSVFFCIAMAVFLMIDGTFPGLHWALSTLIHAVLLLAMVAYFLRYVCPLYRAASKNITTGWEPLIFLNIVFLITIIFSAVFPTRLATFHDPAAITFFFLSISVMAAYPVVFSNINSLSEAAIKREVETQNKLLVAQIEAETAQLAADSRARHDRRHHNLVLYEFAKSNDIESVREYMKNLVESDSKIRSEARYCDHATANTVLSVYEKHAREKGISVKISAKVARDLEVSPGDLVVVIANLFENAIHAAEKMKSPKRWIDISIKESAQRLLIKVENPCKNPLFFDETVFGVGIRSVIAAVDKYEGMYDFTAEDGLFSAKVSLNFK